MKLGRFGVRGLLKKEEIFDRNEQPFMFHLRRTL